MANTETSITMGTVSQRQAAAINSVLSKIAVREPLDSNSWSRCLNTVSLGLAGAEFENYLNTNKLPIGEDPGLHKVIQKCLVTWMITTMSQTESERAIGYITTYSEDRENIMDYKPSVMWKNLKEYHASKSVQKRMILCDILDNTKQGPHKDLLRHIDEWQSKLKSLLEAQEIISDEQHCS